MNYILEANNNIEHALSMCLQCDLAEAAAIHARQTPLQMSRIWFALHRGEVETVRALTTPVGVEAALFKLKEDNAP